MRAGLERQHVSLAGRAVILGPLHGACQRLEAARDQCHYSARLDPKGGHAFHGVEHRQPATGARARVDQPASGAHPRHRRLHGHRELWQGRLYGGRHAGVLLVQQTQDAPGVQPVNGGCSRVAGLSHGFWHAHGGSFIRRFPGVRCPPRARAVQHRSPESAAAGAGHGAPTAGTMRR